MKKVLGIVAVLMLASQFSFAAKQSSTDAAIQRLVKVAKQRQAAREKGEVTVDGPTVIETETVTKETVTKPKPVKPVKSVRKNTKNQRFKSNRRDMPESEQMNREVQRISRRVDEINNNIDKFKKTNELLDKMEERLDAIQDRITN